MKDIRSRVALLIFTAIMSSWQPGGPGLGTRKRAAGVEEHPERGDVPGWVMITLMSAVLVAALLALAGPALEGLFNQAMDRVRQ
ncbi:MAG: hypothetical protein JWO49_2432 [Arthrobacter sp.]|nr:hypothetical protein [Arthrobacter sp.]